MRGWLMAVAVAAITAGVSASAQDCGPDTPCEIGAGSYHLRVPDTWDGRSPLPVVLFFHGHRGSGTGIFRGGTLERGFVAEGYAVVGPNGVPIAGSDRFAWPSRAGSPRDDVAFVAEVVADVARRLPIDEARVYATGFSAGGSMVWQLACYDADRYAGFVALAGTLRRPQKTDTCPGGPVDLLHIHGYRDGQVPLEGRGIRDWHQGDVWEAMDRLRGRMACRSNPDSIETDGPFWCRNWSDSCDDGSLTFCLHDGGHGLPAGWGDLAREMFERPAPG